MYVFFVLSKFFSLSFVNSSLEVTFQIALTHTIHNPLLVFQSLLNVVTTAIETLFVSGNKFLYACVKEVIRL
jgi:hypothetical protein